MSGALAKVDHAFMAVAVPAQASTDDELVALWLGNYRSPATRRGYAIEVRAFRGFLQVPLLAVTMRMLQAFLADCGTLSPASVARRLSAVKSLIRFAHRIGYLPYDVGAPVQIPVVKDGLSERILTEWQVQRMLEMETGPRNGPLLRLVYSAGLRISEVVGLLWRDVVDRADGMGQISVLGKGGKTRFVLLPAPIYAKITALRCAVASNDPVFRSRNGGALGLSQVHRIMKRACARSGLPIAVSIHWLRHAHVSHALDRGAPVHVVSATVGHASLATTTRYTHARPGDSSAKYLVA